MARVIVPVDATPGNLLIRSAGPTVCDLGPSPESKRGAGRVEVVIVPDPSNVVTPDARGQFLHCLWEFARPEFERGRRRKNVPSWRPQGVRELDPIQVETDPGVFWVGTQASLWFLGGTPGDVYNVSVTQSTPYDFPEDASVDTYEPGFSFTLTSIFEVPITNFNPDGIIPFPAIPNYHYGFEVVGGQATVMFSALSVVPLNPGVKVPATYASYLNVSTGVYRTYGGF